MILQSDDIKLLTAFRHKLHSQPELSGEEINTAKLITEQIKKYHPDQIITHLGGNGIAAIYNGQRPGKTILLRAELDALPIQELNNLPYKSQSPQKAHLCGHDGHCTILVGIALMLCKQKLKSGRVILLFQPAEEIGEGAIAVIQDKKFQDIKPNYTFALHNMPGLPLGHVEISKGIANCASCGVIIKIQGKTSHASAQQSEHSLTNKIIELLPSLLNLNNDKELNSQFQQLTLVHLTLGHQTFGITPGHAELWLTLRTLTNKTMHTLINKVKDLLDSQLILNDITHHLEFKDIFQHCENHSEAVNSLIQAFEQENISYQLSPPMRASEDFGQLANISKSAMFRIGSGEKTSELHHPNYDFPDELIETGTRIFNRVIQNILQ